MNQNDLLLDLIREIREDVKVIKEVQIEQGFDIKANKEDLEDHMRRTEIAEIRIDKTEERLDSLENDKKIKKHSWKLISLICAGFAGFVGFIYTIFRFYQELLK